MSDSDNDDKNSASPSLQVPPAQQGESFRITVRASVATGRIKKALDELGRFDWNIIANIVQDALDEVRA